MGAPRAHGDGGKRRGAPLVASGALAVVDVAAQAMVELVPAADVVPDLAAAPGGKTRTLLATGRARRVVALERTTSRALRLAANLAAAGRRREALVVRADAGRRPCRAAASTRFSSTLRARGRARFARTPRFAFA